MSILLQVYKIQCLVQLRFEKLTQILFVIVILRDFCLLFSYTHIVLYIHILRYEQFIEISTGPMHMAEVTMHKSESVGPLSSTYIKFKNEE